MHSNYGDDYTVLVSTSGYMGAGFRPVRVVPGGSVPVDVVLLPKKRRYDFASASWTSLKASRPTLFALLAAQATSDEARQRYRAVLTRKGSSLAALLAIAIALQSLHLPVGTALDYLKAVIWDEPLAQDRFFAWADAQMVDQVRLATEQGLFEAEFGPALFHPGATSSFKQVQFGEANVQVTFHENDHLVVGDVACVKVEPDIDYYKDPAAHTLLEVVPSAITGRLTDPSAVNALRWTAGRRHAGAPEFDPPYTIVPA